MSSEVRVLLVEDERSTAMVVERRLCAVASVNCRVEIAETLAQAREHLARGNFDLVIADLHLPDSPGVATIDSLVRLCENPVIALTADEDPALRERAMASGAYDFLLKSQLGAGALERLVRLAALQANTFHSMRASEARLKAIVNAEPECVKLLDAEGRLVDMNPAGLRMLEVDDLAAVRGHCVYGLVVPEHREAFKALVERAARGEEGGLEFEMTGLKGSRRWLETRIVPLREGAAATPLVLGITRDITAQKRSSRLVALEHAVARLLAEARAVPEALCAVLQAICESEGWQCGRWFGLDEAAQVMRFEHAWCRPGSPMQDFVEGSRGLHYGRGEGLIGAVWESGEPIWTADATSDPRVARRGLARAAGVHGVLVIPLAFAGRSVGALSFSSATVGEPDAGLISSLHAIGSQVAQFLQRKQAESALAESEAHFRRTFELAASGIAHFSLDGRFLDANARLCEILGYDEGELVGRSVKALSHPDDRDSTDAERARMRAGELESVRFEKRYLRKDGSVVWVNLTVALARNQQGEPQHEISVIEDITLQKEREATLQRFRTALDASGDMIYLFDVASGRLLDFNQTACILLGYTREELLGMRKLDIRTDVTAETRATEFEALLRTEGLSHTILTEYRRKDGSTFPVEARRSMIDTPQGRVLVVNSRDLTERRSAEKRRAAQARYQKKIARLGQSALSKRDAGEFIQKAVQSVLEGLGGGAVAYVERGPGERGVIVRRAVGLAEPVADAQEATLAPGAPLAHVLERSEHMLVSAPWADGAPLPFPWAQPYASATLVPVPGGLGARGVLCALAEQASALGPEETRFLGAAASLLSAALHRFDSEARLAYLAQFDTLTGLPNRALLSDRFSQMTVQARRRDSVLGVLFIDLDEFKLVNDTQGHAAGDELLKEVAKRLKSTVRPGDTVARISGDEFAVVLVDLARPDDAAIVAQKILDRLAAPVTIAGQETFITASVGISTFPADGKDAEVLLGAADAAMYRAKQSGRNAFQFFTIEINQRTRARAQLGGELRRALERKEYRLAWQPKIDLASGRPRGAEALLRWAHPERGVVMPAEFIPVLEETGLIVAVGEWVLRAACEDLRKWQAQGLKDLHVAVNLSARQFRQQDLDIRIRAIVEASGVDPSRIELEITESQLMHDPEHAVRVLRALAGAGLRIAIDDFGTGYSSLAYLTRFPLTSLKIDKSFVADVLVDEADATIVRTIIDMAHTLGFTVVAEGVESEQQAALLRSLGCEQAQGYLFAKPMPADDLAKFVFGANARIARPRRSLRRT